MDLTLGCRRPGVASSCACKVCSASLFICFGGGLKGNIFPDDSPPFSVDFLRVAKNSHCGGGWESFFFFPFFRACSISIW